MRRLLAITPLVLTLALSGCLESILGSDDDDGGDDNGPPASVVGEWDLVSVDGESLPVVIEDDGDETITLTAATLLLNENGSAHFTQYVTISDGSGSTNQTMGEGGNYAADGDELSFLMQNGAAVGHVDGDELTVVDDDGTTYVFQR